MENLKEIGFEINEILQDQALDNEEKINYSLGLIHLFSNAETKIPREVFEKAFNQIREVPTLDRIAKKILLISTYSFNGLNSVAIHAFMMKLNPDHIQPKIELEDLKKTFSAFKPYLAKQMKKVA